MGFQDIADLDCQVTVALGGINKKSGKKNPTSVEGFYIGTRQVPSPKSKTGYAALHVFQTNSGNTGVWGKTNLDQKMTAVKAGQLCRVEFVGMVETKNNPMYKYRVQVDPSQTIDVATAEPTASDDDNNAEDFIGSGDAYEPEAEVGEDEPALDEAPPVRQATPPRQAFKPDANKTAALLASRVAKR